MEIQEILKEHGLKVTPQRKVILQVLRTMKNHPTAEMIIREVTLKEPDISTATVYKTLDIFVRKGIIRKIKTDDDIMRYDPFTDRHHHIYSLDSNEIIDYADKELNNLLESYFRKKNIPGFRVKDFRLEIIGEKTKETKEINTQYQ